jgi:hypothetical protein
LTEEELLDKINKDIAIWKSDESAEENEMEIDNLENIEDKNDDYEGEEESLYYYNNQEEKAEVSDKEHLADSGFFNYKEENSKGSWKIPAERKAAAEEIK